MSTSIPRNVRQVDRPSNLDSSKGTPRQWKLEIIIDFCVMACSMESATKIKSSSNIRGKTYLSEPVSTGVHPLLQRISSGLIEDQRGAFYRHNKNLANLLQEGVGHGGGLGPFYRLPLCLP